MIELLSTKLFIPRLRKNLVSRRRLVDRLNAGLDKKLALIAAPAGFGKTTLLSEWIPQSPRCVAWFSLDEGDNDPVKFWSYFIASLQGLQPEIGASILSLLQSPQPPPLTSILTALINDITAFKDMFAIVLDDYHVIDSQPIHDVLSFLIDHMPKNMHLVITTRVDPPLPLARIRAHNDLTEIRANDLRFTLDEVATFLTRSMGLHLSSEEVAALEKRTEGWIAGLQIAALSMQGHDDIRGFVRAFSGSHRHILGYLAEEVINQQPEDILNFLLQTSILDRLCGPLCDAVTGNSGGQTILETLENANLFIMPLDDEGKWYRYHHLFAEVLRARLQQSQSDRIPELHCRASRWLEQNDLMPEAVSHAFASRDYENAARLIEMVGVTQFGQPIIQHSLKAWLAALPEKITNTRPMMLLVHAWQLFVQLDMPAASRRVDEAEQVLQHVRSQLEENEARNLTGAVAAMRAFSNAFTPAPDLDQVLTSAEVALANLNPDEFNFRGMAAGAAGAAHLKRSDMVQAERMFAEAANAGQMGGNVYMLAAATDNLIQVMRAQGRLHEAITLCQRIQEGVTQRGQQGFPPMSMLYTSLADLLREINELESARQYADKSVLLADRNTNPGHAIFSYFVLAHVKQARQEWDGALDVLGKVSSWMRQQPMMWYLDLLPAIEAQFRAMCGDLEPAFRWAMATNWLEGSLTQVSTTWELIWQYEHLRVARAQIFIAQGRATGDRELLQDAAAYLNRQQAVAETSGLVWLQVKLFALQALASTALGDHTQAASHLECALILAQPEGCIRVFVDEGEPMRLLLLEHQSHIKKKLTDGVASELLRLLTYTDKLLAAFPQTAPVAKPKSKTIPEPLSKRELDILQLIASGRTNQEIAEILVIAVSTVKSHINNLYGKLGTNRRTEAIAIAHDLGLLSD